MRGETIYASPCCKSPCLPVKETIVRESPGWTSYYRDKCSKCGKLCHPEWLHVYDSKGVEIKPGDMLQSVDPNSPWQYFACYTDDGESFEIRDLNANNVAMCDVGPNGDVINIGHYSKHLDKLDFDDITYYFATDWNLPEREELEEQGIEWPEYGTYKSSYNSTKEKFIANGGKVEE